MTELTNLTELLETMKVSEEAKQKLTDAKNALTVAIENAKEDTTAEAAAIEECTKDWEKCIEDEEKLRVTARQFLTKKEETTIAPEKENKDVVVIEQHRSVPTAVSAMKTSLHFKLPKPEKFVRGQNFAKFCTKFMDYVTLSNISGDNLHILFLNLVDEFTAEKLRKFLYQQNKRELHRCLLQNI